MVRNLGFAKHRMASIKKRLGRFVGKFNATCATATWVRTVRPATKKEALAATTLLAEIEEEEYTQLAMMADCSVEVGELVLFVDDEEADMTIMSSMAKRCLDRLKWLILERGLLKTGYTQICSEPFRATAYVQRRQKQDDEIQRYTHIQTKIGKRTETTRVQHRG